MVRPVRWLARVFGLEGNNQQDDGYVSFEHVDGSRMAANEFHLSDSMRLDDAHLSDFNETLPAYSHHPITPSARPSWLAVVRH
jgi:hypothetical protein